VGWCYRVLVCSKMMHRFRTTHAWTTRMPPSFVCSLSGIGCCSMTRVRRISWVAHSMLWSQMLWSDQVDVFDIGLSDHHLLRWSVDATHQAPPSTVTYCRAWRRLDYDDFRATLSSSRLCQPDDWPDDVDELASVYDVEQTGDPSVRPADPGSSSHTPSTSFRPLVQQRVTLSALDADLSTGTPQSVGVLLMTPRSMQPRLLGTTNAVPTGSCVSRSALRSGLSGSMLTEPTLGSYDGRWTYSWIVAILQQPLPFMLMSSVSSFLRRWPKSRLPLMELHCCVSPVYVLASRSVRSHLYLPPTSSTPSVGCRISVWRLTQFRRTS